MKPHSYIADLAAAVVLLTRIPLRWDRFSDKTPDFNAAVWAFPVVGLLTGIVGGIAYALALDFSLPSLVAATLAIASMVLLTGAFHEDGLADVADGFGGGKTVARKLEIMRDSRVGAYGVIAIVLVLILRVGGLSALSANEAMSALIVAAMLSRLMMVFVMRYLKPARQDGLAHDTGRPEMSRIAVGTALTFGASLVLVGPDTAFNALVIAFAACAAMALIARWQIKGFSGDVLGAVQQIVEITVLLYLVAHWSI